MIHRLLWNDIRNHKLMSLSTVLFMAASAMLISLVAVLFTGLLGSVDRLMTKAQSPDYLQMHTGAVELEKIADFAADQPEIEQWQVMPFLNLENNVLELGEKSLSDSTQDNGLCVQGERFDYLLGLDDELPVVKTGEVYVPICYRSQYDLCVGDQMQIGSHTLTIAGFIRDSQMNSMLASSKRFLVDQLDYERLKTQGEEEYLIEFLLHEGTDTDSFAAKYGEAQLYANGPAITKPLIKMMNALSDGIMILVILLVAIVVLLISLLCIRFIVAIGMEQDKKEVGMLKAVGIGNESIVQLYFSKYLLLSGCGAVIGMIGAKILEAPLSEKLKEMYGTSANVLLSSMAAALACLLVEGVILLFVRHILKKLEQMTALQALFTVKTQGEKEEAGKYIMIVIVVIILFMRLVIETKRYGISLKKALGFTARCIQWEYLIKGMIPAVFGVFVGILLGNTVGGSICGLILKSLGADGFRFVVCRRQVLLIAIILVVAAANAIWLGIREVKKIKAYEYCMRKE